jgi:hypothetical protein
VAQRVVRLGGSTPPRRWSAKDTVRVEIHDWEEKDKSIQYWRNIVLVRKRPRPPAKASLLPTILC